jgi:hypothetical protein
MAAFIVDVRVEPVAGESSVIRQAPALLCVEHEREHQALGELGRRRFARDRGIRISGW